LPQAYVGMKPSAREGIEFYNDVDDRGPVVRVRSGPVGDKVQRSFARAARLLADDGHDVVLDLVLLDRNSVSSYIDALQGHRTYFIGVHCDGAVLEARELARGDRFQNLARTQLPVVHEFRGFYDLEVDTSTRGPNDLAGAILDHVARQPAPTGMARLHSKLCSGAARSAAMRAVKLAEKLAAFEGHWQPRVVGQFNGHDLMVVKVKGEFVWHKHDDTDDFFLVLEGRITIRMREGDVSLGPGELFVVPKGAEHCPVA